MATPLVITPTPAPETPTVMARAKLTAADTTTLLTAIATANVVTLPAGKTLADGKNFSVNVMPDGSSTVNVIFKQP